MVKTRFAPSPTGDLHLGGVRTALYSWLYARHYQGKFVLRIEDTDTERSTEESTKVILEGLKWLGLDYDEGPFYQTKRLQHYLDIAEQMIEQGLAYRCYCTKERLSEIRAEQLQRKEKPKYDRHCRDLNLPKTDQPYVIRFKNPLEGVVEFQDRVFGHLSFKNEELDDLVLVRSDGVPTYNFCVVIDDLEMGITDVIRGADHINNTPRQINLYRALKAEPPVFAHLPMILGHDGKLLSKRHGATSILQYRAQGFLPEAMLNYLVRLGWSHGDQEIFTLEEMIAFFDADHLNKAAAAFDPDKLLWLNAHYIKTLPIPYLAKLLLPFMQDLDLPISEGPNLEAVISALRERVSTLKELAEKSVYFYRTVEIDASASKFLTLEQKPYLEKALAVFEKLDWQEELIHQQIKQIAERLGIKLGKLAQPIRAAVTGTTVSPPLNVTLFLLGKEKTLTRLQTAINQIHG